MRQAQKLGKQIVNKGEYTGIQMLGYRLRFAGLMLLAFCVLFLLPTLLCFFLAIAWAITDHSQPDPTVTSEAMQKGGMFLLPCLLLLCLGIGSLKASAKMKQERV